MRSASTPGTSYGGNGHGRGNGNGHGILAGASAEPPSGHRVKLLFTDGEISSTEYDDGRLPRPVRATRRNSPAFQRLRWGKQFRALCIMFIYYVAWAYEDLLRAKREVEEAVAAGHGVPETAPVFEGGKGSFVATGVEALRAKRNDSINHAVAGSLLLEDAIQLRVEPPASAWIDARKLSPLGGVTIVSDGEVLTDPEKLRALARRIEREGRWTGASKIITRRDLLGS